MNLWRSLFPQEPHDVPSAIRTLSRLCAKKRALTGSEAAWHFHAVQLLEDWACRPDGAEKLADWLIADAHPDLRGVVAHVLRTLAVDGVSAPRQALRRIAESDHPQWRSWAMHLVNGFEDPR